MERRDFIKSGLLALIVFPFINLKKVFSQDNQETRKQIGNLLKETTQE